MKGHGKCGGCSSCVAKKSKGGFTPLLFGIEAPTEEDSPDPLVSFFANFPILEDLTLVEIGVVARSGVPGPPGATLRVEVLRNGVPVPNSAVTFPSGAVVGAVLRSTFSQKFVSGDNLRIQVTHTGFAGFAFDYRLGVNLRPR